MIKTEGAYLIWKKLTGDDGTDDGDDRQMMDGLTSYMHVSSTDYVSSGAKNCPTVTKISTGQGTYYMCVYHIWKPWVIFEAMNEGRKMTLNYFRL